MRGLIALAAVEQHLTLSQLVLPHVALRNFPSSVSVKKAKMSEHTSEEKSLRLDHCVLQVFFMSLHINATTKVKYKARSKKGLYKIPVTSTKVFRYKKILSHGD
jgi:hypothetical protein